MAKENYESSQDDEGHENEICAPWCLAGTEARRRPSEICGDSGAVEALPPPSLPPSTTFSPPTRTTAPSSAPRSIKDELKALFGIPLYLLNHGCDGVRQRGNVASRFGFGLLFNGAVAGGAWLSEYGFGPEKKNKK